MTLIFSYLRYCPVHYPQGDLDLSLDVLTYSDANTYVLFTIFQS